MKKNSFKSIVTACLLALTACPSYSKAGDNITARVGAGFIVIGSADNLDPDGSKKIIDDLDSAADMEFNFLPVVNPSLSWDIGAPEGLSFFFDTEPPVDEVGGFVFNVGVGYSLPDIAIFEISGFFSPFEEVWKNPYVTGVAREKSDTSKYGAKLAANRILGSNLRLNFVYLGDDVEDDLAGALFPQMDRDGTVYAVTANYSFYLSQSLELRPQISVRRGEYDGDSNSYNKYKLSLKANYMQGKLMASPEIFFNSSEYDEVDPFFGKTRENESFGANLMLSYLAPFDFDKWSVTSLVGYRKGESNIDFYDSESAHFGLFLSYQF